eukprot:3097823-Amphidinium_carterae.3
MSGLPLAEQWERGWRPAFTEAEQPFNQVLSEPTMDWLQNFDDPSAAQVWPNSACPQSLPPMTTVVEVDEACDTHPEGSVPFTSIRGSNLLEECSDHMACFLKARMQLEAHADLGEILKDARMRGTPALASEAERLMQQHLVTTRAGEGEQAPAEVSATLWSDDSDKPGTSSLKLGNTCYNLLDYGEQLALNNDMSEQLGVVDPQSERRQCLLRCVAAGRLLLENDHPPTMSAVDEVAHELRVDLYNTAVEVQNRLGKPDLRIPILEHELRTHVHDLTRPHHDRDYRVLAAMAPNMCQSLRLVIIRVNYAKQ